MQNRIVTPIALAIMSFIFTGQKLQAQWGVDRFTDRQACIDKVTAGEAKWYSPSFTNNHREPREGEEKRQIEERACGHGVIVGSKSLPGGKAWVPIPKDTEFIFRGEQPIAWYKCGNKFDELVYVPVPPPPDDAVTPPPSPEAPPVVIAPKPELIRPLPPQPTWRVDHNTVNVNVDNSIHIEQRVTVVKKGHGKLVAGLLTVGGALVVGIVYKETQKKGPGPAPTPTPTTCTGVCTGGPPATTPGGIKTQ